MQPDFFSNPYRPAAGHDPPHLAGRLNEREDFERLLTQTAITENLILSGLRGVGKTVLLNHMKPIAQRAGWLWTGEDLTEQSSLTEERIATRIITDLSSLLSPIFVREQFEMPIGYSTAARRVEKPLSYSDLEDIYKKTPGLVSDKLKAVLRHVGKLIKPTQIKGVVFAYDEAQNLTDHSAKDQFPLSLILDVFQSIQRQPDNLPFILVLTGLPTLFPKLIEARTYSERMFHTIFLDRLSESESREAVTVPIEKCDHPITFADETVGIIIQLAGGYPYFIQFICKEAFDIVLAKITANQEPSVSTDLIMKKLDQDFFSARWDKVTDKQRIFMSVVAQLPNSEEEFTAIEIVKLSKDINKKPYSVSGATQYLNRLSDQGLIYRNRRGKYQFAVPMMSGFINRQINAEFNLPAHPPPSNGS